LLKLDILCDIPVKQYCAKNNDSMIHCSPFTCYGTSRVLKRTGFHRSGEFHISKRSVFYQE